MRPTISLAAILKNEEKNLPRFLHSVEGCFDEIHLTDTGSTDNSIDIIRAHQGANPNLHIHHFTWCEDFSKARNASFQPVKTDYVMWMDLDDVMSDARAFISWRDSVMKIGDFWLATYNYAISKEGMPTCSFARERVVKVSHDYKWRYFVHEGMIPQSRSQVQYASTWTVNHLRDEVDLKQDRSRNLHLFSKNKGSLDARMRYYYGKELFENGKPLEAFGELLTAISEETGIELHDRVMGIQYACMAAMQLNQPERAMQLAHQGLQLAPTRAEFWVVLGDCLLKSGKALESIPYYHGATKCAFNGDNPIQGPLFQHKDSYTTYPLNQLSRIYANHGDLDRAEEHSKLSLKYGGNPETLGIATDLQNLRTKVGRASSQRKKTDDVVITCPPHTLYEWDGEIYREKGIGGSETAAVEMAEHLKDLTGKRVIVFNPREKTKVHKGVEYRPCGELPEYFRDYSPGVHVAWRHVMRISEDPMYVWCHDLAAAGIDNSNLYRKAIALSPFHASFLENLWRVPKEKIFISRNGINPDRFKEVASKDFGKVVFSSSPDRGLDRAIRVMDEVVKVIPEARLHVYYGFDNMEKMGKKAEVEAIQSLMAGKDYIVYHGNLPQSKLTEELATACVWLYPTNFLETYCITALEALASKVYPVVRNWGALPDTLKGSWASVLDSDCVTGTEIHCYASEVISALQEKKWENVTFDSKSHSWNQVAKEWLAFFESEGCLSPEIPASSSMSK